MGKYQKNIEAARRITVMQYLETYHPGELVRKTDREYCTRTHDSLIITPANGFFHWFSRHVGGNNAIDYLTKVEGIQRNLRCGAGRLCTGGCGFYRTAGLYCARWQHTDRAGQLRQRVPDAQRGMEPAGQYTKNRQRNRQPDRSRWPI